MKTTLFSVCTIIAMSTATVVFAQSTDKLNPGDAMPAATVAMKNTDGKTMTLKSAIAKNGLLVMFSCNTCPFVIKNQPVTTKTIEYAKAHNVGMVIINSNEAKRDGEDSYKEMVNYAKKQGYSVPYLIDDNSKVADEFGANHTPEVFLFDNTGKLVYKGAMNDNPGDPTAYKKVFINDAIDAMLMGKEVNPKVTKSIGCSIKRK
ncbi:hypothetical protein CJD36_000595 [Flavipsychrobacter stenotrophus]|uniref:Thioredoxin domain-containing protein n=1 Tax=Flavipsychrobacter stenotrophus TaxID=2077091 RepID=A0A2S7T091_9BACT|nr:thioredoxin family protein [Flavipsychrobacter stenotrophus]PQJ12291.1 hypothetical protein CJD36_000595 [Flavipsychrobacter stenotrophus]